MAKKGTDWVKISGYLFLLGIVIAIIAVFYTFPYYDVALVLIGTVVGLLAIMGLGSISPKDAESFLMASVAMAVAGSLGGGLKELPVLGIYLQPILANIGALIAPAVLIIALEAIWRAGSTKF